MNVVEQIISTYKSSNATPFQVASESIGLVRCLLENKEIITSIVTGKPVNI